MPLIRHNLIQGLPMHILHHNVALLTIRDKIVDRDNIGVLNRGQEFTFFDALGNQIRVILAQQRLNHYLTFKQLVLGQENRTHTALTNLLCDLIFIVEQIADLETGRSGWDRCHWCLWTVGCAIKALTTTITELCPWFTGSLTARTLSQTGTSRIRHLRGRVARELCTGSSRENHPTIFTDIVVCFDGSFTSWTD